MVRLPAGFSCGHWSDPVGPTGCTVVARPAGRRGRAARSAAAGPGPGRATSSRPPPRPPGPQAVLLTGGSAFGLAAADGRRCAGSRTRAAGIETPAGRVPLVRAGVVYDLHLGSPDARPDAARAARRARRPAPGAVERGAVGRGHGLHGRQARSAPEHATRGGARRGDRPGAGDATVTAIAVVEPDRRRARRGRVGAGRSLAATARTCAPSISSAAGAAPPIEAVRTNTTLVVPVHRREADQARGVARRPRRRRGRRPRRVPLRDGLRRRPDLLPGLRRGRGRPAGRLRHGRRGPTLAIRDGVLQRRAVKSSS